MNPILIVDDEAPIRALIRLTLERAGYTCDEAATGTEAADKIEANTYDLALLDIMLPRVLLLLLMWCWTRLPAG